MQPYISEEASPEQRQALGTILTGQAGGMFFEILAQIVTTLREPRFVHIHWAFERTGGGRASAWPERSRPRRRH